MSSSHFSEAGQKMKDKHCLVLLGYMQKVKKLMDFLLKKSIAKFAGRSKKIVKLAADIDICMVLANEHNLKKLLNKTKVA